MSKKQKQIIFFEFVFNLILVICVALGQYFAYTQRSFMNAVGSPLKFFTNQSNVWIGVIAFVFVVYDLVLLIQNKYLDKPNFLYILKYMCTVAIVLTGLVFNFMLYPQSVIVGIPFPYFSPNNFLVHVVVPILSLISYILFDYKLKSNKLTFIYSLILPLYYLAFSMILSAKGIEFQKGMTVPYFFLDYKTYGWFSIGDKGLGVFYWIIIVILIVCLIAIVLLAIKNARVKAISKKANI